jgi:hypothetical protein
MEEKAMLDSKLTKIRDLIEQKEKIDTELAALINGTDKPRRGRPAKDKTEPGSVVESE